MPGLIVYDSKSLELPVIGRVAVRLKQNRNVHYTVSGKHESITYGDWQEIALTCQAWTRAEAFALYAFWAYARLGREFELSVSSDEDEATTLDGSANSGQKVIPVTSTTGFAVGDDCLIKEASGDDFEALKIASISAGVSITAEDDLKYGYAAGDAFRHLWHWPQVVLDQDALDVFSGGAPALYTDIELKFREVS